MTFHIADLPELIVRLKALEDLGQSFLILAAVWPMLWFGWRRLILGRPTR